MKPRQSERFGELTKRLILWESKNFLSNFDVADNITQEKLLPYRNTQDLKLLGLSLDGCWAFHGHVESMLKELRVRMAAVRKVSNCTWGLENRVLATTVHALVESVINYGLTLTGSPISTDDLGRLDTMILNPVARRVTGVGYSIRREILFTLADIRSAQNHYLLKVANVMDRILRAGGTQAQ